MAKNNVPMDSYTRQQEAIRKAKGNPNKNIHHKKITPTTAAATIRGKRLLGRPKSPKESSCPCG